MPKSAKILKADIQDGIPCIWALVDSEAELTLRAFKIVGTRFIRE